MEKAIYPYKFIPIANKRVWGGDQLSSKYGKELDQQDPIGDCWEIAGFEDNSSKVAEGFLAGNDLYDIIETYMDEIVGEDNYKRFGNEFPILVKMLDITGRISIQVHPDDDTAFDRHDSYGKSEAWYILEALPDAKIYMGFKKEMTATELLERCNAGTLEEVLNVYHPKKGDFFYIPSGTVHSAGGGLVIAEVQQLSDATYRIYDWGRENDPATAREMHQDLALCCIDYSRYDESKYYTHAAENVPDAREVPPRKLLSCPYFTVTEHFLNDAQHVYTDRFESFILYTGTAGEAVIVPDGSNKEYSLKVGEWIMIPAGMKDFMLKPAAKDTRVLEVYIEKQDEHDDYVEEDEHGHNCGCGHDHHHDCDCHIHS